MGWTYQSRSGRFSDVEMHRLTESGRATETGDFLVISWVTKCVANILDNLNSRQPLLCACYSAICAHVSPSSQKSYSWVNFVHSGVFLDLLVYFPLLAKYPRRART